jgi:DNA-binding NarL/FixJ family response regulator
LEYAVKPLMARTLLPRQGNLHPDLVILALSMPVLNGLVAVRQILRFCFTTKIAIFSVHDSEQNQAGDSRRRRSRLCL